MQTHSAFDFVEVQAKVDEQIEQTTTIVVAMRTDTIAAQSTGNLHRQFVPLPRSPSHPASLAFAIPLVLLCLVLSWWMLRRLKYVTQLLRCLVALIVCVELGDRSRSQLPNATKR